MYICMYYYTAAAARAMYYYYKAPFFAEDINVKVAAITMSGTYKNKFIFWLEFIYSEKATKFCDVTTLLLSVR